MQKEGENKMLMIKILIRKGIHIIFVTPFLRNQIGECVLLKCLKILDSFWKSEFVAILYTIL